MILPGACTFTIPRERFSNVRVDAQTDSHENRPRKRTSEKTSNRLTTITNRVNALEELAAFRSATNEKLDAFFKEKCARMVGLAEPAGWLADGARDLSMRGGKRLRPAFVFAAYRAVTAGDRTPAVSVGAAIELMQTYLLIHDDWMDDDIVRRGGPTVHHALSQRVQNKKLGESLGILSGDLAAAWAWELFIEADFGARAREAVRTFSRVHEEVVAGQALDLVGSTDVDRVHELKTSSYTVNGPIALGAMLANATEATSATLAAFAAPIGLAFQLRDDVLGTFGDTSITGKSVGNDIREGKRTALITAAEQTLSAADYARLRVILSMHTEDPKMIVEAQGLLGGARLQVEARIDQLRSSALRALGGHAQLGLSHQGSELRESGCTMLIAMAQRATERVS